MSITLTVHAQVVDLRHDDPQLEDSFYVDTNVWCWLTYSRASLVSDRGPKDYQVTEYPLYLQKCRKTGATLYTSGLAIGELMHIIERAEHSIFQQNYGEIDVKEYRHGQPDERRRVVSEIRSAWSQIQSIGDVVEVMVDRSLIADSIDRVDTLQLDGYDLLVAEALVPGVTTQIISDDSDFATVPDLTLFTANQTVINAAQSQGRLITR